MGAACHNQVVRRGCGGGSVRLDFLSSWASFEYLGVCGLLLTMLSRQVMPAILGATLAIVLNVLSRPDRDAALQRWRQR